jgi:hypothetical protein
MRTRSNIVWTWTDENAISGALAAKFKSKEWTLEDLNEIIIVLGATQSRCNMKEPRAQGIILALLSVSSWEDLRRDMIESATRYPNQNGPLIADMQELRDSPESPDPFLLVYADALKLRVRSERQVRYEAEAVRAEAEGHIANRLPRIAPMPNQDRANEEDELEALDQQPGLAQQMVMLHADAEAYVAGDNRQVVDVQQLQAWGQNPIMNHPALNLRYTEIRAHVSPDYPVTSISRPTGRSHIRRTIAHQRET